MKISKNTKKCLCEEPLCGKCLGVHCKDDNCKIHTKANKERWKRNRERPAKIKCQINVTHLPTPEDQAERDLYKIYKKYSEHELAIINLKEDIRNILEKHNLDKDVVEEANRYLKPYNGI